MKNPSAKKTNKFFKKKVSQSTKKAVKNQSASSHLIRAQKEQRGASQTKQHLEGVNQVTASPHLPGESVGRGERKPAPRIKIDSSFLKIGQAAQALGVSIDTLRRWEKSGKITTVRTPGGTRLYHISALKEINPAAEIYPIETYQTDSLSTEELLKKTELASENLTIETPFSVIASPASGGAKQSSSEYGPTKIASSKTPRNDDSGVKKSLLAKLLLGSAFLSAITLLLTSWITASYLTQPKSAQQFFKNNVASGVLSPFHKLAENSIALISPQKAKELGFVPPDNPPPTPYTLNPVPSNVLAVTASSPYLEINTDTQILGSLFVRDQINGLTLEATSSANSLSFTSGETTLTVTNDALLDQDLSTTSSPTFASINLTGIALVGRDTTDTLTNKSLSGSSNTFTNIPASALTDAKITVTAGTNLTGGGTINLGSSATIALKDSPTIAGTLTVSGGTILSSTLAVTGATTLSSTLDVTGATTLASTLEVTGATELSTLTTTGNVGVGGSLTVTSAAALTTLNVSGISNLAGNVGIGKSANITSLLSADGGAAVSGSLCINGECKSSWTGAGNYTASNGITLSTVDFQLGGQLSRATGIDINNQNFGFLRGNLGIGTTAPVAAFQNAGGTLFGTLSVSDKPTGGNIGTAAATVDIYTSIALNQTTASQVITLPDPTDTTAGRIIYLSNTGTATFTFLNSAVQASTTTAALWNGTEWTLAGGGGLAPGTTNNSTLRWNSSSTQWVENGNILSTSTGNLGINGNLGVGTTGTSDYNLKVLGTGYFSGFLGIGSSINVSGNVGVGSSLTVTSGVNFLSSLNVAGLTSLAGLDTSGNVGIGQSLTVSSAAVLDSLSVTKSISAATLGISGASNLTGNVGIGSSLTVTSGASFSSSLNVTGNTNLSTLNTSGNTGIGASLNVTSAGIFGSVGTSSLSVSGASTLSTLTTSGNAGIGGSASITGLTYALGGLRVNGYSDLTGNVGIGNSLTVNSGVNFLSSLNVAGLTSLAGLNTSGNVGIGQSLTVSSAAILDSLQVTKSISGAALGISGASSLTGNVGIGGTASITSLTQANGGLTVLGSAILQALSATDINSSTLTTTGNIGIGGSLTVTSGVNLSSSLDVVGNSQLSTLSTSGAATFSSTGTFASTLTAANGFTLSTGALNLTTTSGQANLALTNNTNAFTVNSLLGLDTTNKRVGIGTTAPNYGTGLFIQGSGTTTGINLQTVGSNLTQGLTVLDSGNVGIGTTNPGYKLEVAGDGLISQLTISTGENGIGTDTTDGSDNEGLGLRGGGGFGGNTRGASIFLSGNERSSNPGDALISAGNVAGGDIRLQTGNGSDVLVVTYGGNVGIGTTSPLSLLSVSGNAHIGSTRQGFSAPTDGLFVDGNVGIGATTSSNKLDVWGNARVTGNLTVDGSITGTLSGGLSGGSVTPEDFIQGPAVFGGTGGTLTQSINFWWDNTDNRLGIGTSAPQYNLHNAGTTYLSGFVGIGSSLNVSGNVGVGQSLTVSSAANLDSLSVTKSISGATLGISGNVGIGTSADIVSNLNAGSISTPTLSVSGAGYLQTLTTTGNVGIGASLTVTSAAILDSLSVTKSISAATLGISGASNLVGNVGIGSSLTVTSGVSFSSSLNVSGNTNLTTLNATDINSATLTTTGNVGIGATTSSNKLDVWGNARVTGTLTVDQTSTFGGNLTLSGNLLPGINDNYDLGSDSLRWANVYVGPSTIHLGTSTSDEYTLSYDTTNNRLGFNVNGSGPSEITFDSSGNVGIGNTGPIQRLQINPNGTSSVVVTSGGNLGIGNTSPASPIDITPSLTTGTIFNMGYNPTTTLTGNLTGWSLDLNSGNVLPSNNSVTGALITLPTTTTTSGSSTLKGLVVNFGSGSGINNNSAGALTYTAADLAMPALTQTQGTLTANGMLVTTPSSITTGGTANAVNISATGVGAGALNAVNIGTITGGAGTEIALNVASGWDTVLKVGSTTVINGSGVTQVAGGGTGIASYNIGDLLYASDTGTITNLGIGSSGQVLAVTAGVPVWATINGSSCVNCLTNNPSSTQNLSPTGQATTGLSIRQTSTADPSQDIFNVTDSTGATKYFYVDKDGNVSSGSVSSTTITLTPGSDTTALTLVGTNVTTQSLAYFNSKNAQGTIFNIAYGSNQTLTGSLTGQAINFTNLGIGASNQSVTGTAITMPGVTNANTEGTKTYTGVNITTSSGLNQTGAGATISNGVSVTIPALTQTAGTITGNGVLITTPSSITTGGTANGLNISATGVGTGTLTGLNISQISGGAATETALAIGSGWDNQIIASNFIVTGTGNVGIGTTNPEARLHVSGGNVLLDDSTKITWGDSDVSFTNDPGETTAQDRMLYLVRTTSGRELMRFGTVSGNDNENAEMLLYGEDFLDGDNSEFAAIQYIGGTSNERLNISATKGDILLTPAGNVGIGMSAPDRLLHIASTIDITSSMAGLMGTGGTQFDISGATTNAAKKLVLGIDTTNNYGVIQAGNTDGTAYNLSLQPGGGNVGIGTTSPGKALEVVGDISIQNNTFLFGKNTAGAVTSLIGTDTNNLTKISTSNHAYFVNYLGVNATFTSQPASPLSVNGGMSIGEDYYNVAAPTNGAIIQGNVGIGTSTANSLLSVAGGAHIGSLYQGTVAPTNGLFVDGNVGIGATTSSNKLDVWGDARITGALTVDGTLTNSATQFLAANGSASLPSYSFTNLTDAGLWTNGDGLLLTTGGSNTSGITVTGAGNVGVGTTAPISPFEVDGDISNTGTRGILFRSSAESNNNGYGFTLNRSDDTTVWGIDNTGMSWGYTSAGATGYKISSGESSNNSYFNIAGGNVGIGTSIPLGGLHVYKALDSTPTSLDGNIIIETNGGAGGRDYDAGLTFMANGSYTSKITSVNTNGTGGQLAFSVTNSWGSIQERMRLNQAGNLGIGVTTANSLLSVAGGAHIGSVRQGIAAPTDGLFVDGNVGIGATTSSNKLDVWGNARIAGTTTIDSTLTALGGLFGYAPGTALSSGTNLAVSGNLGIGTTSPSQALDVVGSIAASSEILVASGLTLQTDAVKSNTDLYLDLDDDNNGSNNLYVRDGDNNIVFTVAEAGTVTLAGTRTLTAGANDMNLGAASSTETNTLQMFYRTWRGPDNLGLYTGSTGGSLYAYTKNTEGTDTARLEITGNAATANFIISNSNVGIGTTNPGSQLGVSGNAVIGFGGATSIAGPSNGLAVSGNLGIGLTNANAALQVNGGALIGYTSGTGAAAPSNGLAVSGNVGIGTTGPTYNLVVGNDLGSLSLEGGSKATVLGNTGGNSQYFAGQSSTANFQYNWKYNATPANGYGELVTSGYSNPIKIDGSSLLLQTQSSGNVGIGFTSPDRLLQMSSDINIVGSAASLLGANGAQFSITGSTANTIAKKLTLGIDTTDNYGVIQAGNSNGTAYNLALQPGGGSVGIGTTTPSISNPSGQGYKLLEIYGAASQDTVIAIDSQQHATFLLDRASTNYNSLIYFQTGESTNDWVVGTGIIGTDSDLSFYDYGGTDGVRMIIQSSTGNVGIGTTSPLSLLSVAGGAHIGSRWQGASAPTDGLLVDGNVGIGITTPGARLHVVAAGGGSENALAIGTHNGENSVLSIERYSNTYPVATIRGGLTDNNIGVGIDLQYRDSSGVATSGIYLNSSGNVGIGTVSPIAQLDVRNTNTSTGLHTYIGSSAGQFAILDNGNVGIGTTAPAAPFQISQASSGWLAQFTANSNSGHLGVDSDEFVIGVDNDAGVANSALRFDVDGSAKMRITANGNVGIGTTSPERFFHLSAEEPGLLIKKTTSGGNAFLRFEGPSTTATNPVFQWDNSQNTYLRLATYDGSTWSTRLAVDNSGNLGLGTVSPLAQLDVRNTNTSTGLHTYIGSSAGQFSILDNGNVGIGTTDPDTLLHLSGSDPLITTNNTNSGGNALGGIAFNNAGSTKAYVALAGGDDGVISGLVAGDLGIRSVNQKIAFSTDNGTTQHMVITGGNVGIGTATPGSTLSVIGNVGIGTSAAGAALQVNGGGLFGWGTASTALSSGSIASFNGNVGIGKTNADYLLDLYHPTDYQVLRLRSGSATSEIAFQNSNNAKGFIDYTNTNFQFYVNDVNTPTMTITGGAPGNVGIGTATPVAKLHLIGAGTTTAPTLLTQNSTKTNFGLTALDNGNVGIGKSAPDSMLHIYNNSAAPIIHVQEDIYGGEGAMVKIAGYNKPRLRLDAGGGNAPKWDILNTIGVGLQFVKGTAGTDVKMTIDETSGNIGIGFTSPAQALHLVGTMLFQPSTGSGQKGCIRFDATNQDLEYSNDCTTFQSFGSTAGGWSDQGTYTRLTTTSANVGIGIAGTPAARVHMLGQGTGTGLTLLTQNSTQTNFGLSVLDNGNVGIGTSAPVQTFQINASSSNPLVFTSGGNLGIGTTNPLTLLHLKPASGNVELRIDTNAADTDSRLSFYENAVDKWTIDNVGASADILRFNSNTTSNILTLTQGGNVGIGTASPASILDVVGNFILASTEKTDATAKGGRFGTIHYTNSEEPFLGMVLTAGQTTNILNIGGGSTSGNAATEIRFLTAANNTTTAGTQRMTIDSTGNVGIADGTPSYTLDVTGTINATSAIYVNGSLLSPGTGSNWTVSGANIYRSAGNIALNTSSFYDASYGPYLQLNIASFDDVYDSNMYVFETQNRASGGGRITFGGVYTGTTNTVWGQISGAKTNATADNYGGGLALATRPNGGAMTERVRIDEAGNVGIGFTTPGSKLDIWGNADQAGNTPLMKIVDNAGNANSRTWGIGNAYGGATYGVLGFFVSSTNNQSLQSTPKMVIQGDGNVGIGDATPSYTLEVAGTLNVTGAVSCGSGCAAGPWTRSGTFTALANNGDYVGIGFTSPTHPLLVRSDVQPIMIGGAAPGSYNRNFGGLTWDIINSRDVASLVGLSDASIIAGGSHRLFVRGDSGNVGIGNTGPAVPFDIRSTASSANISYISGANSMAIFQDNPTRIDLIGYNAALTTYRDVAIRAGADPSGVYITTGGNVGIGTASPTGKLHIQSASSGGTADATADNLVVEDSGNAGLTILGGAADSSYIEFGDSGSPYAGIIQYLHSDSSLRLRAVEAGSYMLFQTANTERMRIDSSGNVGILTTSTGTYNVNVAGSLNATSVYSNGVLLEPGTGSNWTVSGANIYRSSGSVGIGTASPNLSGFGQALTIRNASNTGLELASANDSLADGTFVGSLRFKAGTADNDIAQVASDVVGTSENSGQLRFTVWNAGSPNNAMVIRNTGNVGIGFTSPASLLHLYSTSGVEARLQSTGSSEASRLRMINNAGGNWYVGAGAWNGNSNFQITNGTATASQFDITTGGNVGIGTSSPSQLFQINYSSTNPLVFTSSGNLGIGITTPNQTLNLAGTMGIRQSQSDATQGCIKYNSSTLQLQWSNDCIAYQAFSAPAAGGWTYDSINNYVRLTTTSSNVGIGFTSPTANLHIVNTAAQDSFRVDDVANDDSPFVINQSGSVGIGFTSPATKLHVFGSEPGIRLQGTRDTGGALPSRWDIKTELLTTSGIMPLIFAEANGGEIMRLQSDGNVGIGTASPGALTHIYNSATANQAYELLRVGNANTSNGLSFSYNYNAAGGSRAYITNLYDTETSRIELGFGTGGSYPVMTLVRTGSATGNVGIGTTNPGSKLEVDGGGATNPGILLDVRSAGTRMLLVSRKTSATEGFNVTDAAMYVGTDTTGRSINAGGTINASGSDYAEYFIQEQEGALDKGDVVCLANDSSKVTKCSNTNKAIVGVVSTNPAYVGNDIYDQNNPGRTALVGLMGQVPTKISNLSGNINVGDYLTMSTEQGKAIKSTGAGQIIGKALESWTPGSGKDRILVYINVGFADPNNQLSTVSSQLSDLNSTVTAQGLTLDRITQAMMISDTGNIGIGVTPAAKLHISGDSGILLNISNSTSSLFNVSSNGNIGIGTTDPQFTLEINGTGKLNDAGWTYASDLRLKENINQIGSALDIIEGLNPVTFDYIDGGKNRSGFIAQEVQAILPSLVTSGSDGMLGIRLEELIPYTVKAIQELNQKVSGLENQRISEFDLLKAQMTALQNSIKLDEDGTLIVPKLKTGSITLDPSLASTLHLPGEGQVTASTHLEGVASEVNLSTKIASLEDRIKSLESVIAIRQLAEKQSSPDTDPTKIASSSPTPRNDEEIAGIATDSASLASASTTSEVSASSNLANTSEVNVTATPSASLAEATSSATPSADLSDTLTHRSTDSLNLTPPDILLATASAQLVDLTVTSEATISGLLTAYNLNVQEGFKSFGKTTLGDTLVAGTLTVNGSMTITENSISTLGDLSNLSDLGILYLQNDQLAQGLDVLNGAFTFTKDGTLTVNGTVLASQFAVKSGTTAGVGTILAGQTDVILENAYVDENSVILITPHQALTQTIGVADRIKGGFRVALSKPEGIDIKFDYMIIGVKP